MTQHSDHEQVTFLLLHCWSYSPSLIKCSKMHKNIQIAPGVTPHDWQRGGRKKKKSARKIKMWFISCHYYWNPLWGYFFCCCMIYLDTVPCQVLWAGPVWAGRLHQMSLCDPFQPPILWFCGSVTSEMIFWSVQYRKLILSRAVDVCCVLGALCILNYPTVSLRAASEW